MTQQQENEDSASGPTTQAKCFKCCVTYEVVIVVAAFIICTIYAGTLSVSGLYLKYFLDTFGAGKVTTTGVISLQGCLTYFSGVVVGPLIVRFGTRKVAVAGSLSASVGLFVSGFTFNIIWLYVCYGAFTGFGCGVLTIASGVCIQEHTNKRRALAGTVALCGGGCGILIMPQITEYAMIEYGERGSLLILGGIMLNTLPCALLLRPQLTKDIERKGKIESKPSLKTSSSTSDTGLVNPAYKEEAGGNLSAMMTPYDSLSKGLGHKIRKGARNAHITVRFQTRLRMNGLGTIPETEEIIKGSVTNPSDDLDEQPEVDKNVDNYSANGVTIPPSIETKVADKKALATGKIESTLSPAETIVQAIDTPTHPGQQTRPRTVNVKPIFESSSHKKSDSSAIIIPNTSAISDDSSNAQARTISRLYQRRKTLREVMTPVSLENGSNEFTIAMAFIICAYFFWIGGFFGAYVFTPAKAHSIGLGASESATFLSLGGIGDVVGRVMAAFLSPCHDKLPAVICIVGLVITGLSCAFIGICRTYTEVMMALIIYGIANGMASVVWSTTFRDIIGVRHFALILGYASAVGGIGNLFCMQLVSFIWEKTGDISIPFGIAGGFLATAGLLIMAAFIANVHAQHKNLKDIKPPK